MREAWEEKVVAVLGVRCREDASRLSRNPQSRKTLSRPHWLFPSGPLSSLRCWRETSAGYLPLSWQEAQRVEIVFRAGRMAEAFKTAVRAFDTWRFDRVKKLVCKITNS